MQINNLKKALDGCNEKTERLLKDLVEKTMNETNENLEIPYLKQIFRVFLSVVDKNNHSETQHSPFRFQVRNSNNKILQRCLDDEESAQTCVDCLTNFLKSGHVIPPYDFFEKFSNFLDKIKPFFFIAFFVCFLFQIYTPLLRIGRGGDKRDEVKFLKRRVAELEEERHFAELRKKNGVLLSKRGNSVLRF